MGLIKRFFGTIFAAGMKSSLETASARQAVEHLLPEEAYLAVGFDRSLLEVSDAALRRLMSFTEDVRLNALLDGLDDKEAHIRAACAFYLLHWRHPQVLAAMRRHMSDSDDRVSWRAKFHVEHYGGTTQTR